MARATEFDAGRAFVLAEERVKGGAVYRRARLRAIRYARDGMLACNTVDEFRAAGGRTAICRAAIERAIAETKGADALSGSRTWPVSAALLLRRDYLSDVQVPAVQMEAFARRGAGQEGSK